MSWRDRDGPDDNPTSPGSPGYGRPGGDWRGLRPSFDNPASWSIFLMRFAGIDVRIHILFILFIVVQLLRAMFGEQVTGGGIGMDVTLMLGVMAALFVVVLLHEFGHCIACRMWGGSANEILMWPLGGLAYVNPPNRWQAHMATVIGGPLVNVAIFILAAPLLGLVTGVWFGVAIPNPLNLFGPYIAGHLTDWGSIVLYVIHAVSFLLLLFNLLPMFPLDGGRIVQAALWRRIGYVRSMRIAVRVGYVGAIVLGVFGLVITSILIVLIAVFCGITCYITHKQLAFTEEMMGHESDDYALSLYGGEEDEGAEQSATRPSWRQRRAERAAEREREESKEVDRILEKIAGSGMESLTRREKRLLQRVTERKRQSR